MAFLEKEKDTDSFGENRPSFFYFSASAGLFLCLC